MRTDWERRTPAYFHSEKYKANTNSLSFSQEIPWEVGEVIRGKYRIGRILGEGTFGVVMEVIDEEDKSSKAVKVVRPDPIYINEAKIEAETLRKMCELDLNNSSHIVKILDAFIHQRRYCIIFEKLGKSLYSVLEKNHFKGFKIREIREFSRQLLEALNFLHSNGLTHTDLKPENILLINDTLRYSRKHRLYQAVCTDIKLIDFGGATFEDDYHPTIISTCHYRAPEVLMQSEWSMSSDMWSLGCILFELYTGDMLFPTENERLHLAMMEKLFGRIPIKMVKNCGKNFKRYFDSRNQLIWPETSTSNEDIRLVEETVFIEDMIPDKHAEFKDFVLSMLKYNSELRPSPSQALRHCFIIG